MDLIEAYHATIGAALGAARCSDKTMHVHAGLALYLTGRLVFSERRASINAWLLVFACEAGNEAMDRLYFGEWRWPDTLGDVATTLFWPTILLLLGPRPGPRHRRGAARAAPARRPSRG